MKKFIAWLKKIVVPIKWRKYVIICVVGVLLVGGVKWLSLRPIHDKVLLAQMKVAQVSAEHKDFVKANAAKIAKLQKTIQEKDYLLDRKDADIERKDGAIADADVRIASLIVKYNTLTDCPSKLANMTEQKDTWAGKFSLAEGVIQDYKDKVFLWRGKYSAAFSLAEVYRTNWQSCEVVVKAQKEDISVLRREISKRKIVGTVKSGLILAAAGYLLYGLIKK